MIVKIWLALSGLMYLVLGYAFIFRFESVAASLDIAAESGSAAIEIVTVYGGLEIGMGLLFLLAVFKWNWRSFSLQLLTFSYACFVVGRLAGMAMHEVSDNLTYQLLGFEMVGLLISAALLKRS